MNDFIYIAFILFASMMYHELGHFIAHSWYNRNPKLHLLSVSYDVFPKYPYEKKEVSVALIFGIFMGIFPILFSIYFQAVNNILLLFMLAIYIIACKHDIKELKELNK